MYFLSLFLISSSFIIFIIFTFSVLYCAHLWLNFPLIFPIFLKRSLVFPFLFFPLFLCIEAEEGFLISSCYSLELCIQMLSFSPLLFASLPFTAICKASPDSHFAFLHFFSMGATPQPRSNSMSKEQPHIQGAVAAWVQEGQEELLHIQGQEGWLWGDTLL